MRFPLYRKYPNNLSFFKIIDDSHFIEIKRTGRNVAIHHFEARILPDRYLIQDMLTMEGGFWVESTSEEFNHHFAACR
ncbi:MAG: hypothetical protein RLP15_09175 [Cryomorphaceae bacterium]